MTPAATRTWAVVGGSGFVGAAVVHHLSTDSDDVRSVPAPRLTGPADGDPTGLRAALEDEAARTAVDELAKAFTGVDVVVNAAGLATPDAVPSEALTGANAVLPAVVVRAAEAAAVPVVVHISSAAVQGRMEPLDESARVAPATPYAQSKAWGESMALDAATSSSVTVLRATSIQDSARSSTARVRKVASSPLASVAGRGDRPTPVCSPISLAEAVAFLGTFEGPRPAIVLQPWDGLTTEEALRSMGADHLRHLPTPVCRAALAVGYGASRLAGGRGFAALRRIEIMWLGQQQVVGWLRENGLSGPVHRDSTSSAGPDRGRGPRARARDAVAAAARMGQLLVQRREPAVVRRSPSGGWQHRYRRGTLVTPTLRAPTWSHGEHFTLDVVCARYRPEPGDVVVDLGAGCGTEAVVLADLVGPTGRVIACEAHPWTAELLRETVAGNALTNVTVVEAAVGPIDGHIGMTDLDVGANISNAVGEGPLSVPSMTFERLLRETGVERVDLVKVNIEGAERHLFGAMGPVWGKVRHAVISCHDFKAERTGDDELRTREEVRRALEDEGFAVTSLPGRAEPWIRDYLFATAPAARDAIPVADTDPAPL